VWNDSARLADFGTQLAAALADSPLAIHWVIADDGSAARDHAPLRELRDVFGEIFPRVHLHLAERHHGKGAVVREAWTLRPEAAWLAFVDADGSVTPAEMLRLIHAAVDSEVSVLGIRKRTATTEVVETPWRGIFHRGFLLATHVILGLQCADPQCGAKVLHGGHYRRIAGGLLENGLAFDSELLCALKRGGSKWSEIPVNWIEKPGGKVRPLRDAWGMFKALLRIRKRRK
jgi:dolichyl-phosphate beta-glucosyltransferase